MTQEASKTLVKDMTDGIPARLILGFAVPMLFGFLFQQFYSMVDTVIVGKFLGVDALASVGSTSAVNFMINGFVIGICSGFAIPVAQRFGARDYKDMRRFVANAVWLSFLFASVMTVSVSLLARQILILMQTPENIIDGAYDYILFIFIGIPATYLYNMLAGIIRSLGDSKTPVYFLVFSSFLNILLDLLFIVWLQTGVAGAAYATVISQAVSGFLCFMYMLCKMGVPMGLQYSITAIGSVVIQTAINSLGSAAVASVTAGQKVSLFFCCPFEALGGTMATYAGQNAGAGKINRIWQGVRSATALGAAYAVIACAVLYFFGDRIPLLFVDAGETEVIRQAHQLLIYNHPGHGLQPLSRSGRRLRDDRQGLCRFLPGSSDRLYRHLLCLSPCLDHRGRLSHTGLLSLHARSEEDDPGCLMNDMNDGLFMGRRPPAPCFRTASAADAPTSLHCSM